MLYIRLENFAPVEVQHGMPENITPESWAFQKGQFTGNGWINRNDIKTFEYANTLATLLTEKLGRTFLATDATEYVSPRYDVIEAPKIGDKVSRGFNGDYYPEGTIVKISPTYQVTTSTGVKFRRRGQTGSWKNGRTWSMVAGHHDEQNPHF